MNGAHLHIMLVHIPVVLVPIGVLVFLCGLWRKSREVSQVALGIFMLAAVAVVPAFLLGEGAEEIVEEIAGVSENLIEAHEEVADFALWLTVVLGATSLLALIKLTKNGVQTSKLSGLVLLLALISSGSLAYAAQKGGMIRHPEAFPDEQQAYQVGSQEGKHGHDGDD